MLLEVEKFMIRKHKAGILVLNLFTFLKRISACSFSATMDFISNGDMPNSSPNVALNCSTSIMPYVFF